MRVLITNLQYTFAHIISRFLLHQTSWGINSGVSPLIGLIQSLPKFSCYDPQTKKKKISKLVASQRMRESEAALRQLIQERNEAEREKWTILRHARDEAERCLSMTTQLTAKDAKIDQLQEELVQVRPSSPRKQKRSDDFFLTEGNVFDRFACS